MKKLVLVAAHFTPSNLAGVHRARLLAQHLGDFGWEPIIVTTHWDYYEEKLDWGLHDLVDRGLRVIRARALPTRPLRVIGDLGIRALPWHYRALSDLARAGEMDFLYVTIPSNFSALLGRMIHHRYRIPYGIDYIDPWVAPWPGTDRPLSKAWAAFQLSKILEPWAVREASLITGVAPLYYEDVLARNPGLHGRVATAAMPYGCSERDFEMVHKVRRDPFLFDPKDGLFHMFYAGGVWPKAEPVVGRLLEGIARLSERRPDLAQRFRLHLVGTSQSEDDPRAYRVRTRAEQLGVGEWVHEHPARIAYLDVLNHLIHSSGNLIFGSIEKHYTPSKAFQVVQARRPLFAVLHAQSTAAAFLRESRAGTVVTFADGTLPSVDELAVALERFLERNEYDSNAVRWDVFDAYSARQSARVLAEAATEAFERARRQER